MHFQKQFYPHLSVKIKPATDWKKSVKKILYIEYMHLLGYQILILLLNWTHFRREEEISRLKQVFGFQNIPKTIKTFS